MFYLPMNMNPLPPQAYTKETLVQAYAWLQSQKESIKEMATNPDILVGLYLKAKLQGDGALERPSIQNFKHELKNLAGMMGEFEVLEPKTQPVAPKAAPIATAVLANPSFEKLESLDPLSQSMIREVKTQFNLSSESEALRLLLSVGHKQLKTLLKS